MESNPENQNHKEIENQDEENGEENDEVLDDDYLLQLHQYLQEMKRQRKQAEQDANLLGGRLRVLRDEEKKTMKVKMKFLMMIIFFNYINICKK